MAAAPIETISPLTGGFNLDAGANTSQLNNVGIDFIQEVSIKTCNFSAEYGRNAGASVNVVTRSGGEAFHGGAFEYHRNNIFDAINPINKVNVASGTSARRACKASFASTTSDGTWTVPLCIRNCFSSWGRSGSGFVNSLRRRGSRYLPPLR